MIGHGAGAAVCVKPDGMSCDFNGAHIAANIAVGVHVVVVTVLAFLGLEAAGTLLPVLVCIGVDPVAVGVSGSSAGQLF